MLSIRMQWSLGEAFWSTSVWTIIMMIMSAIFSTTHIGQLASALCGLAILPPIMYRWLQFYSLYSVHSVLDASGKVRLEIGHRHAFEERYSASFESKNPSLPNKFAFVLDNDIVVAAESNEDLTHFEKILADSKVCRKYVGLIAELDKYDVKLNFKGEISYVV